MKNKGFTLIELLAVFVILAIIALIAVPIVMNIVENSIVESRERSVELYASAIKNAVARKSLTSNSSLNGEFTSSEDRKILTSKLLGTTLNVEYDGDKVICSRVSIYEDGKIYLAGCSVNGEPVEGFTYGKKSTVCTIQRQNSGKYTIGDLVTCTMSKSIEQFYVLENADSSAQTIEMLAVKNINVTGVGDIIQMDNAGKIAFSTISSWSKSDDIYNDYGNVIKPIVNQYVMYLNENLTNSKGKILRASQAIDDLGCDFGISYTCPAQWIYGYDVAGYWLGDGSKDSMYYMNGGTSYGGNIGAGAPASEVDFGVRPVIVIQTSDIK